jgi:hypothetical protein
LLGNGLGRQHDHLQSQRLLRESLLARRLLPSVSSRLSVVRTSALLSPARLSSASRWRSATGLSSAPEWRQTTKRRAPAESSGERPSAVSAWQTWTTRKSRWRKATRWWESGWWKSRRRETAGRWQSRWRKAADDSAGADAAAWKARTAEHSANAGQADNSAGAEQADDSTCAINAAEHAAQSRLSATVEAGRSVDSARAEANRDVVRRTSRKYARQPEHELEPRRRKAEINARRAEVS